MQARVPAAEAVLPPPPAVAEYDFGGAGPPGDLIFGGRSVGVDISPSDITVAFEGSESGGLAKTTDGGVSWNHVFGFPQFRMSDVSFDPNDSNILYATTFFDGAVPAQTQSGVWRSTNGGAAWGRASVPFACTNTPNAYGIGTALGADTHQKVFVGTDCGVAYSNDSGATWSFADPSGGAPTVFFDVAAVRTGANTAQAYACSGAAGVYTTTVAGAAAPAWTPVLTAFPAVDMSTGNWCQIAISPLNTNVVYLTNQNCPVVGSCTGAFGARVYEIDIPPAGAATITDLSGPLANNREPYVTTHRATDGDATHLDVFFNNGFGMYRQHCINDGNAATVDCPSGADPNCADAVDNDGDQMVNEGCAPAGPNCAGGSTPCPENSGLTPSQCKNAADDDGDAVVNDGCEVMEFFTNGTHVDTTDLAFDTSSPTGCPLLTSNDGGIGRSTNCGSTWADSNAGRRKLQIYNLFGTLRGAGPTQADLYFGTQDNEWFFTLDNGGSWTKAFCCEGFLGRVDYRSPPVALGDIRATFVNCAACSNQTSERGFASRVAWPNPPGGGGNPIPFGNERYAQFSSDLAVAPNFQLYIMRPETGAQCANNTDDDLDTGINNGGAGAVNDGCPAVGGAESGAQCHNNTDDDGGDGGAVNDGCSHIFSPETGGECGNATDDDGDNVVNDGCPQQGTFSETGAGCLDAADDADEDPNTVGNQNDDAAGVNDGCPEVGVWGPMGPTFTQPPDSPIQPSGPVTGPSFFFTVDVDTSQNADSRLRRIAGPMNVGATLSDVTGTGANTLGDVNAYCIQFLCPRLFTVDPADPTRLYAADDTTNQIKFSNDAGLNWQVDSELTPLVTNNGQFLWNGYTGSQVTSIAYDPEDGQRLLVGTETAGIFASVNGGGNWFEIRGSDGVVPLASSFFFDNDHDVIYASTFGRGLWTLTLPDADLSITKSDFPDPVMAGQELFYTITVTNNGPNPATAQVIDMLPPQVQYIGNDLVPPLGCTESPPGLLRCDVGALDTGDSITFVIKVRVRSNAALPSGSTTIINTATVVSTDTTDPDLTDNTASATTFAEELSDLTVTKICKPDGPLLAGETGTCTIYVDNLGPSDARSVVMEDSIVSDGTFTIGAIATSHGTCNPPTLLNVVHCDLGDLTALSPSSPGRATVTVDVTATEQMDINDFATVVSATPDPDMSNNMAQESLNVQAVSNLALTKFGPPSAIAGTNITYNLTVTNNGPSTATGVLIEDVLSSSVTVFSVIGSGGATCNAGFPGDPFLPTTCSYGNLAPLASRTMTIVVTVKPDVLGTIHNDARALSQVFDDDAVNNLATVATNVTGEADVSVVKTATPNPVVAGTALSYQITVSNAGPSVADDVVLSDPLNLSLTLTSVSSAQGSCGLQTSTNTVECAIGDIAPGESVVVYIYTNVAASRLPSPPSIANTATVSSATFETNGANNSSMITTGVITQADLTITLTSDKDVYKPSTVIHYTITVKNLGPSDAQSVVVTQMLPPTKTAIYQGNNVGCPAPVALTFTCSLGTIEAGGTRVIHLDLLIRGNKRTIFQTATVVSTTPDPTTPNTSTRMVTVK